jgi:hypothetical protein
VLYTFEDELQEIINCQQPRTAIDITLSLDSRFTGPDRKIVKGTLIHHDDAIDTSLEIIMGFRSDLMNSFDRFEKPDIRFLPCDIIGLVPCIASLISLGKKVAFKEVGIDGLVPYRLELRFHGVPTKKGSLHDVIISLVRFMNRWQQWTEVILNTLSKDPVISTWNMTHDEIRELLLGESGFITMPWFRKVTDLNLVDRARILDRIQDASKALLTSVLTEKQLQEPTIRELMEWLEQLTPLPMICSSVATEIGEEVV